MYGDLGTRTVANANLPGGAAASMIASFKALFTRGRLTLVLGYRSKRVTLALAPFFFFTRRVYTAGRVTLASGLPYLPCKRSARDNSPTLDNFPPLTRVIG